MLDIGYLAAFLGGVLALLSPCSSLLLPSFFAYAFQGSGALLARTGLFYLGLAAVLVPLGSGSTFVSVLFYGHREALIQVAGWTIIVFGAAQILGFGFGSTRAAALQQRMVRRGRWASVIGLGAAYGLAGFCSGPILGSVLTVAAASGRPLEGAALLAVYALGMTAPMFLLALLWQRFDLGRRRWLRGRVVQIGRLQVHTMTLLSGGLFIVIGALFLSYDGTAGIAGALGLGDTTDLEYSLQQHAVQAGRAVPDALLIGIAATALVALVVWRVLREVRAGAGEQAQAEDAHSASAGAPSTDVSG